MKPKYSLLASIFGSIVLSGSSQAVEYWWDSNSTTAGFGNTTGTWGTSAFWSTSSAGTGATANTAITNADDINFGTSTLNYANGAVVLGANQAVSSIQYGSGQTTGITLSANTLTIGGTGIRSGITMNSGATAQTISSAIVLNGTQNWTNNSTNALVLSNTTTSVLTGTANLGINGSGRISITGLAGGIGYSGNITISGGGELESRTNITTNGVFGTGNINVTGGTVGLYYGNSLTRAIGTGNGQIQFSSGVSGISSNGASSSTFTLSGMTWGTTAFNPSEFVFQNSTANTNGVGTLAGNIDLGSSTRTIRSNQGGGIAAGGSGTFSGNISNGGITKVGVGTHIFSGTNTYTGGTNINAGVLRFNALTSMPASGTVTVADGATLGVNVNTGVWGGGSGVAGIAGLTSTSNGGNGFGGQTGAVVDFNGNSFLNLNVAGNVTESNAIGNGTATSIGIIKTGASTLTLSGSNTYTGGTTILAGQITLGHASNALADTGAVTVSGGTLALGANSDTVGAVTLTSGSITSSTGTLTGSSFSAQSGTISAILAGSGVIKSTTGALTVSGASMPSLTINAGDVNLAGTNTFTSGITLSGGVLYTGGTAASLGSGTLTISSGTVHIAASSGSAGATLTSTNANTWNGSWTIGRGSTGTGTWNNNGNVTLGANVTVSSANNFTALNLGGVISGAFSLQSNANTTTLSGANTFTGGVNHNTGTLNINNGGSGGTSSAIGTGTLTFTGTSSFDNTSGSAVTLSTNNALAFNANATFNGSNDLNLGTGSYTSNNGARQIIVNGSGKLTIGGNAPASANALNKFGTGTLALTGSSALTGNMTINAGVLEATTLANGGVSSSIGASSAAATGLVFGAPTATLRYMGSSGVTINRGFTLSSGAGGGATIESSGTGTLSFNNTNVLAYGTNNETRTLTLGGTNTGANTFGKVIANNGTGATTLNKSGLGTWVLDQTNTYTGGTNIAAGTLAFNSGSLGTTGNISFTGSSTLRWNGTNTQDVSGRIVMGNGFTSTFDTNGNNVSFASAIGSSTTGAIAKSGAGTLTLTGTGSYTGGTTINAGTLAFGSGSLGSSGNITFGGTSALQWSSGNTQDVSSRIVMSSGVNSTFDTNGNDVSFASGIGATGASLTKAGAGKLTLQANATYTGTTTISGGTLEVQGSLASSGITNNGALVYNNSSAQSYGSVIDGSGSLTKEGAGTLNLTGANTYSGTTSVTGGTLHISGTGDINGSSGITVNGGHFKYNSSTNLTAPLTFTSGTVSGTNLAGISLTVGSGDTISPGNSPGTMNVADQTWAAGGTYLWELYDATGVAGTGWDLLAGTGTLDITASLGSEFIIDLTTLAAVAPDVLGDAINFNANNSYAWLIADFASVTGFNASDFTIDATGFSNAPLNGSFGISLGGGTFPGDNSQVYLTYTAIPEPGAALLGGLGVLTLLRRRRSA